MDSELLKKNKSLEEDETKQYNIKEINLNFSDKLYLEKKLSCDLPTNINTEESKLKQSPDNSLLINNELENLSPKKKIGIEDFEVIYVLGKGSYAKVVLAKNIYTNKISALKIMDKKFLKREKKEYEPLIEKYILLSLDHPNIIKLHSTFHDSKKLYFILDYCPNRDLADFLKTQGTLSFELAQFFAAEIVLALEYIHNKGIYHRDLKPENIILDENMHLKLVDFATASINDKIYDKILKKFVEKPENFLQDLTNDKIDLTKYHVDTDLIGTPEYISPESLILGESSPSVDLWALGCIIYLFFHGETPFKDKTNSLIFEKIKNNDFKINQNLSENTKDIINKLLIVDPKKRLGGGSKEDNLDMNALKRHKFFENINFNDLKNTVPPINVKKLIYSKTKFNSTNNININHIDLESKQKLFFHKNISNQNIIFNNINQIKKEMDLIYGADNNSLEGFGNEDDYCSKKFGKEFNFDIYSEGCSNKQILESQNKIIDNNIFQIEKDPIIMEDIVQKKSPWFHYNTRVLKLFKSGKLEYLTPINFTLKGTIVLDKNCSGVLVEEKRFDLITKNRKFIFKVLSIYKFSFRVQMPKNG